MMNKQEKATLLIVDDVPTNLKVLLGYLHNLRFKLLVAEDGEDALAKASYAPPDLILLDVMMPRMDGFETCRRLKANPETRDIPVIFMTARTDTVDKITGFEIGAVDYITKPVQHEEVLARINTHLTMRNMQKTLEQQNKELNMFAHTIVHDLKEPLTAVSGLNELLTDQLAGLPEPATNLRDQTGYVRQMSNTVDALLLLISTRMRTVPLEAVNMGNAVAQTRGRLTYMIKKYQAEIIVPEYWPVVMGYMPWLVEIWASYISNGIKYGGKPPRLELGSTSEGNGAIRFWVHDNGPGLNSEEQSRLFAPQSPLGEKHSEGYGLGLTIVQRMMNKCGGEAGVESTPGEGSTFYFILPKVE
ncbi:MAG: response regulator [Gammaproteobacteria bacterium]|nr:response regulator [Gammaproteobacteria bacterium]